MKVGPIEVDVNAPRERVFGAFCDLENMTDRISGITKIELLTDGEVGKGTRWAETRVVLKREHTEELEFDEFSPPGELGVRCESCGVDYRFRYAFSDQHGSTRVVLTGEGKPLTFMARLMTPVGLLFSGTMKKALLQDMEDLKAVVESGD